MRSRWRRIHICRSNSSHRSPKLNILCNFIIIFHLKNTQPLHINSIIFLLSNFQPLFRSVFGVLKQIKNMLIVNFKHGHCHLLLNFRLILLTQPSKYLRTCHRYNPNVLVIPYNRITFPTTRLPVREQARMIPLPRVIQNP